MIYKPKQFATKVGTTIRTLHYYDEQGILKPDAKSVDGTRTYTDRQISKFYLLNILLGCGIQISTIRKELTNHRNSHKALYESHLEQIQAYKASTQDKIETVNKVFNSIQEEISNSFDLSFVNLQPNYSIDLFVSDLDKVFDSAELFPKYFANRPKDPSFILKIDLTDESPNFKKVKLGILQEGQLKPKPKYSGSLQLNESTPIGKTYKRIFFGTKSQFTKKVRNILVQLANCSEKYGELIVVFHQNILTNKRFIYELIIH